MSIQDVEHEKITAVQTYLEQAFPPPNFCVRTFVEPRYGRQTYCVDLDGAECHCVSVAFEFFDDTPIDDIPTKLHSFRVENTDILLANCHLLYGPQSTEAERTSSMERRQLEAYAIARWCDLRRGDTHAWTSNILAVGDFNLPRATVGDPIFDAWNPTSRIMRPF